MSPEEDSYIQLLRQIAPDLLKVAYQLALLKNSIRLEQVIVSLADDLQNVSENQWFEFIDSFDPTNEIYWLLHTDVLHTLLTISYDNMPSSALELEDILLSRYSGYYEISQQTFNTRIFRRWVLNNAVAINRDNNFADHAEFMCTYVFPLLRQTHETIMVELNHCLIRAKSRTKAQLFFDINRSIANILSINYFYAQKILEIAATPIIKNQSTQLVRYLTNGVRPYFPAIFEHSILAVAGFLWPILQKMQLNVRDYLSILLISYFFFELFSNQDKFAVVFYPFVMLLQTLIGYVFLRRSSFLGLVSYLLLMGCIYAGLKACLEPQLSLFDQLTTKFTVEGLGWWDSMVYAVAFEEAFYDYAALIFKRFLILPLEFFVNIGLKRFAQPRVSKETMTGLNAMLALTVWFFHRHLCQQSWLERPTLLLSVKEQLAAMKIYFSALKNSIMRNNNLQFGHLSLQSWLGLQYRFNVNQTRGLDYQQSCDLQVVKLQQRCFRYFGNCSERVFEKINTKANEYALFQGIASNSSTYPIDMLYCPGLETFDDTTVSEFTP